MIVKDIRYIIKRIIIGVGIALILMLIKGNLFLNVSALEVYSHDFGSHLDVISSTNYQTYYNTNNFWSDWGNGYIHFAFSVMKNAGQNSVSAIVQPRSVYVSTGVASFVCDIGSVNSQNSTYNDQVYSATCPVSFYSGNGLRTIYINFSDIQSNDPSTYRVTFDGKVTFEKPSSYPTFNADGIINSQNSNNQALINNQNTNTQSIINNQNSNNQALLDQNQQLQNTLNDTSTTQADNDASNFFGNFSSNSHGLSGIISAPLRLIQSISSSTCSPLTFPLPFVNENVSLPCMSTIYTTYFNSFLVLYRLITTGLIGYWVCVRLFSKVKDFQNPDNDRIEVLDL